MKKWLAFLLSAMLLLTSLPTGLADGLEAVEFEAEADGVEEDAVFLKAGEYGDRIRRYLSGSGLEKLVLFVRSDMAPIARIQNRFRAHLVLKIIDSPKCAPLRTFVTDMLREENETLQASGISAVFEINPLSLA